jgi:hypothetical protein
MKLGLQLTRLNNIRKQEQNLTLVFQANAQTKFRSNSTLQFFMQMQYHSQLYITYELQYQQDTFHISLLREIFILHFISFSFKHNKAVTQKSAMSFVKLYKY